jgi:hypothetical protein
MVYLFPDQGLAEVRNATVHAFRGSVLSAQAALTIVVSALRETSTNRYRSNG